MVINPSTAGTSLYGLNANLILQGSLKQRAPLVAAHAELEHFFATAYLPDRLRVCVLAEGDEEPEDFDLLLVGRLTEDPALSSFLFIIAGHVELEGTQTARATFRLGWVPGNRLPHVVEAVILLQRAHRKKNSRRQSTLATLIARRGVAWFRRRVMELAQTRLHEIANGQTVDVAAVQRVSRRL